MAGEPIKLGSALESRFIFQAGSTITISDSGIQECSIKALWPDGATVMDNLPAAGTTYDAIFANSYLPADFKLDRSKDGSVQVEYLQGKAASVTFSFKRPDPTKDGKDASRKVSLDTSFRFIKIDFVTNFGQPPDDSLFTTTDPAGIPEPVVTVSYNTDTLPRIGASKFALPGSPDALGFPICDPLSMRTTEWGYTVNEFNLAVGTVSILEVTFNASPSGWQLTGLSAEPQSGESFYDAKENWRMHYVIGKIAVVSSNSFVVPT